MNERLEEREERLTREAGSKKETVPWERLYKYGENVHYFMNKRHSMEIQSGFWIVTTGSRLFRSIVRWERARFPASRATN